MSDIKFKLNGYPVAPHQLGKAMGDALEKAAFQQVKQTVEDQVRRIRCPQHHSTPGVRATGSSLKHLSWSVSGCCDRVIEEAKRVLR